MKFNFKEKLKNLKKKGMSIGSKLVLYFLSFVAIAILVMWGFQIFFINTFYELTKKTELSSTAVSILSNVDSETLEDDVRFYSFDRSLSIALYQKNEDGTFTDVVNSSYVGELGIFMGQEKLQEYYAKAEENKGSYTGKLNILNWQDRRETIGDPFHGMMSAFNDRDSSVRLFHCVIMEKDGTDYFLFIETAMVPFESTIETLELEYTWIALILIICAIVLALASYRNISKPIIKMNEEAKKLATGKYDVHFEGKGYKEVRELANTLNYASEELSQLDALQKELIANISHDLRTPLTMIRGYAELMRDIPTENTPENVQIIIDETEHLSELVSDMLDLSRIQSGTREINKEPIDLNELLQQTMKRYDSFARHDGYKIELSKVPENTMIFADKVMILQVLYNLINNAIHYTGEDKNVNVVVEIKNEQVRISIKDHGQGISPEDLPHIWERYYRGDKVHRSAKVGSGIGLSIVKNVLEVHNAVYGVESEVGKGSNFWFELPLYHEENKSEENTTI